MPGALSIHIPCPRRTMTGLWDPSRGPLGSWGGFGLWLLSILESLSPSRGLEKSVSVWLLCSVQDRPLTSCREPCSAARPTLA